MSTVTKISAAIAAILTADKVVSKGIAYATGKAVDALGMIAAAAKDFGPCNSARFDSELRKPLAEAMKDSKRYSDKVRKVVLSTHCKSWIALSNGILPDDGENEQAFVNRVTPDLKARKLYIPANAGGNGAKKKAKGKSGKAITLSRESALATLVGANVADRLMVSVLVKHHMDKLRTLYASIVPADKA